VAWGDILLRDGSHRLGIKVNMCKVYGEYKGRVYTLKTWLDPDDLQHAHAIYYRCTDILTGEEIDLKGHALRLLSDMEVLALTSREDE